jgi:hypothetical protein
MQHHHPDVSLRADGRWVVNCPECERQGDGAIPIGIGMPIREEGMARMVLENHLAKVIKPMAYGQRR